MAMSRHLADIRREHVILERARVAESWRTQRWDSLMFQFPNWSIALPSHAYAGDDADGFSHKDEILRFIEDYALRIEAPIRAGVNVVTLRADSQGQRYLVLTDHGEFSAENVVVATGPYQRPRPPSFSAELSAGVVQIHASQYRNPGALPDGAVLVVGSGASGCQIADELLEAGRRVYLSVGKHRRVPRRYRGRDFLWWFRATGWLDRTSQEVPGALREQSEAPIVITGVHGGYDIDLRRSRAKGMVLVGRILGFNDGWLHFARDLKQALEGGDQAFMNFRRDVDQYIETSGISAPPPDKASRDAIADDIEDSVEQIDVRTAGIHSVIWATGYACDFDWIQLPIFDRGEPIHRRGVTAARGIYFLGLPWQHKITSSFLSGVGADAAFLAEYISKPN